MGPEDPNEDDLEQDDGVETEVEADDGQGEPDGQEEVDDGAEEPAAKGDASQVDAKGSGQERPVGRGERAVLRAKEEARRAQDEARQARELAAQTRRDFEALQQRLAQPDPRLEAERLAAMSTEERFDYFRQQDARRHDQELARLRLEVQDSSDRAAFAAMKATNPIAARLDKKVEETLAAARASGQNYPREVLLKFLAGEEALAGAAKARATQAARGATNIARQRTTPSRGGSDVQAERRSSKSLEDRLAGVTF